MYELVKQFLPDLTWAIFWVFLLGVVILIIAGVILLKNLNTYARERAAAQSDGSGIGNAVKTTFAKIGHGIKNIGALTKKAREKAATDYRDEAARSFGLAIDVLKGYFGPTDAQYKLPWYMVIGCEESGKSTLIDEAQLELPIGEPVDAVTSDLSPINWTFFDQAVMADIRGDLLLRKDSVNSDDGQWTYILNLFKFHRPKRPIDGIILTIPADEVLINGEFSKDMISERGRAIYAKLWKLQNTLGMRVPVYVVITKSDKVPGFSELVAQLPAQKRNEILGWSSPYDANAAFNPKWVDVIFKSLRQSFNQLRAAVFTRDLVDERRIGNALLPIELAGMKETLGLYLTALFKESSYHDSFLFRGVYFTGLGDSPEIVDFIQKQEENESSEQNSDPELGKMVFVKDLLSLKVFKEYALCEPNTRLLVSTNKALNVAKVVFGVIALVWCVGLTNTYTNLRTANETLYPSLSLINDAIIGVNERASSDNVSKLEKYLNVQSERVLAEFAHIDAVESFSIFMPASWFSVVDEKIERSFTAAYDKIVLPSLSTAIREKIKEVVSMDTGVLPAAKTSQPFPNPTSSPSFRRLQEFVVEVSNLEQSIHSFNRLSTTTSIQDLGRLTNYLFNRDLPRQFYSNNDYYRRALENIFGEQIYVDQYSEAAQVKLKILYKNFLQEVFDVKENLPVLVGLQDQLQAITHYSAYKKMDESDLRQLTEKAIAFADLAVSGKLAWLSRSIFDPGADYSSVMDSVVGSQLLGRDVAQNLGRIANLAFSRYRLDLANMRSEITGTFFTVDNGNLVSEPSAGTIALIDALSAFLNEPFMAKVKSFQLQYKIPPGRLLFWDDVTLNKAVRTIDAFNEFLDKRLMSYSPTMQEIFREVGRNSVRKKTVNYVSLAQTYQSEPTSMTDFGARELLKKQVANIAMALPLFSTIMGVFDDGSYVITTANLRELLINQNYSVLEKVNRLLSVDNLYSANEEELRWWDGSELIAFKLFNVADGNDMNDYLAKQRFSITFLANEMAKPIVEMLSQPFLSGVPMDLPLVQKWTRIIAVLKDYENKVPGNSLQVLEQFLTAELNTVTLDNCLEKTGDFDKYAQSGDYFLDVRNHYFEVVEKQCENIGFKDAVKKYNKAASFFNANLAGRFPFTKELGNEPDAGADDVATFLKLFDTLTPQQLEMLKHAGQYTSAKDSLRVFIENVVSILPLLKSAMDKTKMDPMAKVNLLAEFRTDREREKGGENIIDWSMRVANSVSSLRANEDILEWRVGMPVDVMIKWAQNAETVPLPDPRYRKMNVLGSHAVFSYDGRWSLIRMLREHAIPETALDASGQPGAQILRFDIPTAFNPNCYRGKTVMPFERESQPVKIYMRLNLGTPPPAPTDDKSPPPAENESITAIIPTFPFYAPAYQKPKPMIKGRRAR